MTNTFAMAIYIAGELQRTRLAVYIIINPGWRASKIDDIRSQRDLYPGSVNFERGRDPRSSVECKRGEKVNIEQKMRDAIARGYCECQQYKNTYNSPLLLPSPSNP